MGNSGKRRYNSGTLEGRFWANIVKGEANECWGWVGYRCTTRGGYGALSGEKPPYRPVSAHRLSYEIHKGPIPDGLCVLHRCDNPPCTNPEHLFLGDRGDNARDMARKGRWRNGGLRGEDCGRAKLSAAQAREIVSLYRAGGETHKSLGVRFRVSPSAIRFVLTGRTWAFTTGL